MSRPTSRSSTGIQSRSSLPHQLSINQSTNYLISPRQDSVSYLSTEYQSPYAQHPMRPSSQHSLIQSQLKRTLYNASLSQMSPSTHVRSTSQSPQYIQQSHSRPCSVSSNIPSLFQSSSHSIGSGYTSPSGSYPRAYQSINQAMSTVPASVTPLPKHLHKPQNSYDPSSAGATRSYAQSPPQGTVFSIQPSTSPGHRSVTSRRPSTDLERDLSINQALQTLKKRASFKQAGDQIVIPTHESQKRTYNDSRSQSSVQSARSSIIRSRPQAIPSSTSTSMTPQSTLSPYHSQRQSLMHGISYQTNHPSHNLSPYNTNSPPNHLSHMRNLNNIDQNHISNYQSSSRTNDQSINRSNDYPSISQRITAIAMESGSPHRSQSFSQCGDDAPEISHAGNETSSIRGLSSFHHTDHRSTLYSSNRTVDPSMVTMSRGQFASQTYKRSSVSSALPLMPKQESPHFSTNIHAKNHSPLMSASRPNAHSISMNSLSPRSDSTLSNLPSPSHAHSPAQIRSISHSRSISRRSSIQSNDHVASSSSEAENWSDQNASDSETHDHLTTNRYKTKPVTPIYTGRSGNNLNVEPATSQTPSRSPAVDLQLSPITPIQPSFPSQRSLTQSVHQTIRSPSQILTTHQESHRQAHSSTTPLTKSSRFGSSTIDRYSPVGLMNLGNTCFFNSALQCLLAIPDLFDYFAEDPFCDDLNPKSRYKSSVAIAFGKLVAQIAASQPSSNRTSIHQTLNLSPISPTQILKAFTRAHPSFAGYGQHDSQEAVRCLLDSLHEDLNQIVDPPPYVELKESDGERGWWQNYLDRNDSVFSELFTGQLHSSLECQACHRQSNAWDPFWDLQLPIVRPEQPNTATRLKSKLKQFLKPSSSSPSLASLDRSPSPPASPLANGALNLYDCFQLFLSTDTLTENDQLYCPKCKTHCDFSKKFSITRWPPVLTLHLKRFAYHAMTGNRKKIDAPVDFSQELDLTHLLAVDDKGCPPEPLIYDLVSVSCHSGSTAGGHYTAMVRMRNRWFLCNDSRVYEIQGDQVMGHNSAYLLFYQKRE